MATMASAIVTGLLCLLPVTAQIQYKETIWSSVIFTRYGERTPLILPEQNVLTPLGAQQLYSAGSSFRKRYIAPPSDSFGANLVIQGISTYEIDNSQLYAMSTVDEFVVASAQAFIQGLYPPLRASSNNTVLNSISILANGSNIDFPLDGYQYPQIYTASDLDPNSIWLAGEANCPAYSLSDAEYFSSQDFVQTCMTNDEFYKSLEPSMLNGELPHSILGYRNAYNIFDYLSYGYTHNRAIKDNLPLSDLAKARMLADQWVYSMNGNISANGYLSGDRIRTIAGQTLAAEIMGLLFNSIETSGSANKISLLFGSFEPFVAFAALARLPSLNTNFYGLPDFGSSMVFELFSVDVNNSGVYPSIDELNVRFLFRNGTNVTSELISYPLFGRGPSQIHMTFQEFLEGMEDIMLPSVGDWCNTCGSVSIFCSVYANSTSNTNGRGSNSSSNKHHSSGLKPALAGVIGAIVALAIGGLLLAVAMLLGGFRMHRVKTKRRSALGGFKGGEKLASDPDLTTGKAGAGVTVSSQGHSRVGSWELDESHKAEAANSVLPKRPASMWRPSSEDGDISVNHFSAPVKVDERV
ncbi:MAG: hypothetical protein M1830_000450 [Pleopsidium flavum]|nr:MAG: hypothetical protein M1830_001419 [Pleopsidium flavum]KAI9873398.1 MAG: hypothetical protein M1830_000450 [Pleopsidium flavum]